MITSSDSITLSRIERTWLEPSDDPPDALECEYQIETLLKEARNILDNAGIEHDIQIADDIIDTIEWLKGIIRDLEDINERIDDWVSRCPEEPEDD